MALLQKRTNRHADLALSNDLSLGQLSYDNPNFTYPDAMALTERLLEQSQKRSIFRLDGVCHTRKVRGSFSESCIPNGTFAPTSTLDLDSLSQQESTSSLTEGEVEGEWIEIGEQRSNVPLAQTCSTIADIEILKTASKDSVPVPPVRPQTEYSSLLTYVPAKHKELLNCSEKEDAKSTRLPRSHSFLGPHVYKAKQWTKNKIADLGAPSRRSKIREGKKPLFELPHVPPPKPPPASPKLADPCGSKALMGLEGGSGPPKAMSLRTLTKLDEIEVEQWGLRKRLDDLERSKQELLMKEGAKAKKERKNVFKEPVLERTKVMPYGILQ
jgi:hypothetical protein